LDSLTVPEHVTRLLEYYSVNRVGALVWFGAHYAQKARKVRLVVIAVGVAMSAYYFVTVR
jgi:hypothetical protein